MISSKDSLSRTALGVLLAAGGVAAAAAADWSSAGRDLNNYGYDVGEKQISPNNLPPIAIPVICRESRLKVTGFRCLQG